MTDAVKEPTFRSDMDVELVEWMASDAHVVRAARVSTLGKDADVAALEGAAGLIRFLARNRHGSPFEHALFTFRASCPIFVWRELMRHRIASYNEESGRYKELEPVFYQVGPERALVQVGKAGAYEFEAGSTSQLDATLAVQRGQALDAYRDYRHLLDLGVAREVARMHLPLSIYSTGYVTLNARSLMNVLSLRTKRDGSAYPSFPQREIEMVAEGMERYFRDRMPLTAAAFDAAGRVSP